MRIIEKVWFTGHWAKWLLVPLLLPLTVLFYLLSAARRILFSLGLKRQVSVDAPVIIVGNIGVGGNGKTPTVVYLVELTRALGFTPGVISRGYGGKAPNYPYLLTQQSTSAQAGDEPVLLHRRCRVPVVVGSDRIASAELLIKQNCNVIISDDGLQHYRLGRTVELVIVDAKRRFGNGLLLPSGPLREGIWRLNQSDLVVFNGDIDKNTELFIEHKLTTAVTSMTLQAREVRNLLTGESVSLPDFLNENAHVNAIAGIGDPQRFFDTLIANDFSLTTVQGFVDHHHFCDEDFTAFNDKIPLIMTEKDAVKCQSFAKPNWWYLPVDAVFSDMSQQKIKTLLMRKLTQKR